MSIYCSPINFTSQTRIGYDPRRGRYIKIQSGLSRLTPRKENFIQRFIRNIRAFINANRRVV